MLVLAGGNDLSTHDTRQRMALLLKQMQVSVPPQVRPLKLLSAVPITTLGSKPPCGALCCRDKPPLRVQTSLVLPADLSGYCGEAQAQGAQAVGLRIVSLMPPERLSEACAATPCWE